MSRTAERRENHASAPQQSVRTRESQIPRRGISSEEPNGPCEILNRVQNDSLSVWEIAAHPTTVPLRAVGRAFGRSRSDLRHGRTAAPPHEPQNAPRQNPRRPGKAPICERHGTEDRVVRPFEKTPRRGPGPVADIVTGAGAAPKRSLRRHSPNRTRSARTGRWSDGYASSHRALRWPCRRTSIPLPPRT